MTSARVNTHRKDGALCACYANLFFMKMGRTLLFLAVLVPLVCFLLLKYQDGDFILMIYEVLGKNPNVALHGKVVWITGASSGIGEYLAYELAKCGCKLVLSARRKEELERVKKNCVAISSALDSSFNKDRDIIVLPLDLQKFDTHKQLAQDVIKHFGKVDILVNNGARSQLALLEKTPLEDERALLDLNLVGTISLTKAILPYMIERNDGKVVVVSSVAGKTGSPYSSTYSASKHGLHGYFEAARLELAEHNIQVQIVCPGPVKSQLVVYAYTGDKNTVLKDPTSLDPDDTFTWMPTERCAKLMAVSMANDLDEVWISNHVGLIPCYLKQYFPNFFLWFSKKVALKMTREYLEKFIE